MYLIPGFGTLGTLPTDTVNPTVMPFGLGGLGLLVGTPFGGEVIVSAASKLWVRGYAFQYVSPIVLSAANSFTLSGSADLATRFWAVSATTGFHVASSPAVSFYRAYDVSAKTGFSMRGGNSVVVNKAIDVSASNSMLIRAVAANTLSAHVSASNSFAVSILSRSGRDLFVSATTSMGFASDPKSNRFFAKSGSGSFVIHASASASSSGPSAHSGFTMACLAQATVVFPWRRHSLTLPPGGNLPHS